MDTPVIKIDLTLFISLLKEEKAWKENDKNTITLLKTNTMSILLIALQKGATMPAKSVSGILSIEVTEGVLELKTKTQIIKLCAGQMLALHNNIEHTITAIEETSFLLTINTSDDKEEPYKTLLKMSCTEAALFYKEIF